jgi:general secretion pathway protein F
MKQFSVTVLDTTGQLVLLKIQALDAENARQIASASHATVLGCELNRQRWRMTVLTHVRHWFAKTSDIDPVVFSQDISTLIEAGVSVKEAISTLNKKERTTNPSGTLGQIETAISHGLAFSEALRQTRVFPEVLIATVSASEQTGDLATGLSRYARHQQSLRVVRDKVVGACVYPMLLLAVGSMVIAILLGVVVPKFATLMESSGKQLPWLSRVLMDWGGFVDAHPWVPSVLIGLVVAGLWLLFVQLRQPESRRRWLQRIPGIATVAREFEHLQLYRTTAILTARGISIHRALVYGLEFLNAGDQVRLTSSLNAMREGVGVSDALERSGLTDAIAASMLHVAEKTGSMPEILDRIADFHERTLARRIDIVSRLIEPLLMIIFGILIGGIVILMYLPIFDLASSLS